MPETAWIDPKCCKHGWLTAETPAGLFVVLQGQAPELVWIVDGPEKVAVSVSEDDERIIVYPLPGQEGTIPGVYVGPVSLFVDPKSIISSGNRYVPGDLVLQGQKLSLATAPPYPGYPPRLAHLQGASERYYPYVARCTHWALFFKEAEGEGRMVFERRPQSE